MMKYKVGDRVKVRSDLTSRIKKNIVTITFVHDDYYEIKEDVFDWTDKMFEGLAEDELTAEEAIRISKELCAGSAFCSNCPIGRLKGSMKCRNFQIEHPDKVIEILKQWKKDHEKEKVETEIVYLIRVMKEENDSTTCIYAYEIEAGTEKIDEKMDELVKQYYEENGGKIYATFERICKVKS